MGIIGRMTINTIQIRIDDGGLSMGPRPMGENREKMIPTYRLMSGAGVTLDITLAKFTRFPSSSSSSSWYFTGATDLIQGFNTISSIFVSN